MHRVDAGSNNKKAQVYLNDRVQCQITISSRPCLQRTAHPQASAVRIIGAAQPAATAAITGQISASAGTRSPVCFVTGVAHFQSAAVARHALALRRINGGCYSGCCCCLGPAECIQLSPLTLRTGRTHLGWWQCASLSQLPADRHRLSCCAANTACTNQYAARVKIRHSPQHQRTCPS